MSEISDTSARLDEFDTIIKRLDANLPIVYPTSTQPALGVRPSGAGLDTLFKFKRRAEDKPVSLAVAELSHLPDIVKIPPTVEQFLKLLPAGSVTIIFTVHEHNSSEDDDCSSNQHSKLNFYDSRLGGGAVAIRVVDHPDAKRLLSKTGPLTATSANQSGAPPALDCATAAAELGLPKDAVISGICHQETPSTLIRWPDSLAVNDEEGPQVLRLGVVSANEVKRAWMTAS
jgi:L-threonylcarbamoyladenylate synthase